VGYTKKIKGLQAPLLSQVPTIVAMRRTSSYSVSTAPAFASKDELAEYLERLEQAKARDHRKLGKELKLFHIDEAVGAGMVLWTPNGAVIRQELQNFIAEELRMADYDQVFTPHIGKLGLYRTSGHFPYYKDSQFPPIVEPGTVDRLAQEGCSCGDLSNQLDSGEIDGYLLKPMNCPMHIKVFDSQAPLLSRPSCPPRRVWHCLSLGTIWRTQWHDSCAWLYAG
jgi:threonyl-tRNA synthetase